MTDATTAVAEREGRDALTGAERAELAEAIRNLHASRGLVVRGADLLASAFGGAATFGMRGAHLPSAVGRRVRAIAERALRRAFDIAILGIGRKRRLTPRRARLAVAASGAVGGFAGFVGSVPDVALTTLLIMRTIADIARAAGEDLSTEAARQACLEVFAFGGAEFGLDEDTEVSYWSARLALQGRPLVLLMTEIAGRYGLHVSQTLALRAMPLIGAAGGAMVNAAFFQHYRRLAELHFLIRRLERRYGADLARREAVRVARAERGLDTPAADIDEPFVSGA